MTIIGLTLRGTGYGTPQYGALSVIVAVRIMVRIHTLALPGVHLDVTHVTSTHFVPLPVLVPVGISAKNKSLSRTQFQGFGNSNPTMCQEERELEISLKNTNNYQSFVDSGPGPWQNCEGRTFPLGAPDSQCPFSSLFHLLIFAPSVSQGPFLPPSELVTI